MKSTLSHITLSAAAHRAQGVTPDEKRRSARPSHAVVRALSMTMGAIGLLAGSPAQGGDSFWTSSANGTFSDPGNWNPGVPGALDSANFDNNATYTVSWSADAINAEARYNASGGGELTWSVGGANTWRLTDRLVVGQDAASFGTVWHTSGTIAVTNTSGTGELVIRENAGFAGFSLRDGTLIADRITAPNGGFTWNFFGGTLTTTKGVDVGAGGSTVDFVLGSGYYGPHAAVWNVAGGTNIIDIGTGRFRGKHLDLWCQSAADDRDAADEPAPADRGDDGVQAGGLFQEFQRGGSLACDHATVVVGMDEAGPGLGNHLVRGGLPSRQGRLAGNHPCTIALHRGPLDGRCAARHHDMCINSPALCRQGDRLGMVSTAMGDHAIGRLLVGQCEHGIGGAAKLEGPYFLQVLAFEKQLPTGHLVQGLAGDHRGLVDVGTNPLPRFFNLRQGTCIRWFHGRSHPLRRKARA